MELYRCQDLTVGYEGKAVAEKLNFSLSEGEYLCIVGENGSGKSTLLKTLAGLMPPLSGKIERAASVKKAGAVGYLPQVFQMQRDFPAAVEEVVRSGFAAKSGLPFYHKSEKKLAEEAMDHLGVLALKKRRYSELSGGQQRRVLLARALLATGKVLLLDEPAAGLDEKASHELYELIASFQESGAAVAMVTHDLAAVHSYATHILHISRGGARYCSAIGEAALSESAAAFKAKSGNSAQGARFWEA